MEGQVALKGSWSWSRAWAILDEQQFTFYKCLDTETQEPRGVLSLFHVKDATISKISVKKRTFCVKVTSENGQTVIVDTFNSVSAGHWYKALLHATTKHSSEDKMASKLQNYIEILEIQDVDCLTSSSLSRIYKTMSLRSHPDKGGHAETFNKIREAYEYLSGIVSERELLSSSDIIVYEVLVEKAKKGVGLGLSVHYDPFRCVAVVADVDEDNIVLHGISAEAGGGIAVGDGLIGIGPEEVRAWPFSRIRARLGLARLPLGETILLTFERRLPKYSEMSDRRPETETLKSDRKPETETLNSAFAFAQSNEEEEKEKKKKEEGEEEEEEKEEEEEEEEEERGNQRVSSQVTPSEVTAPQNRHQGGKPQVVSLPVSDAPFTHDETQVLPPLSLQLTQMKDKSDLLAPFMALRDVVSSSTVSKSDFSRLLDLSAAILLERDARVRKEKSAVADSAALRSALDDLKLNHAALSRRHEAALRFIEQLEGESDHELTIRIQKWLEAHCHEEQIQDAHTGGIHGSYTQTVDRYYVSKERTVDLQRVQEKAKGVESQLREALRKSQVS
jgi:hypothetical protein